MAWALPTASATDWRGVLIRLLPKGPIWGAISGQPLYQFLQGIAVEPARIHNRILALIEESDPRTSDELLDAWEVALGLPDECTDDPPRGKTLRQAAAAAKLAAQGGSYAAYIVQVCAAAGFTVEVVEPAPFRAGSPAGNPAYGEAWAFAFIVDVQNYTIVCFAAGDPCGGPICAFGEDSLECLIDAIKPAQTTAVFDWS